MGLNTKPTPMEIVMYFGRKSKKGIAIFHVEDGEPVTRLSGHHTVYPVGSSLSADWEHPEGVILHPEDAQRLGIEIEVESK